jgi:monoamine oxidase
MRILDPPGQPADVEEYTNAEAAWRAAVTARLGTTDCSLAEAASTVANDPWTPTIETWEGAIIAAGDADELSLADWHTNELDGENYVTQGGLGALVGRLLATPAQLGVAVTALAANTNGVQLQTAAGTIRAGAAIVTVSTGVLRDERIRFDPGLPQDILAALDGLPMGLLSKIALRAVGGDRLGLPPGAGVFRRLGTRGAPFLSTIFWGGGTDLAVGFVGGRAAWALAHNPSQAGAFMRAELAATFGHDIGACFAPTTFATNWGADPHFQGAYAYARPGFAHARAVLGTPLWDGRLLFAGEALSTNGLAGTIAGAYETGIAAARRILHGFTATRACV